MKKQILFQIVLFTSILNKIIENSIQISTLDGLDMQPQHPVQIAVSNTETIAGATIVQSLGLVTGSTVRAKNIGKDIMAGLKNIVGGELGTYTQLLNEARNQALQRMMADAQARGANAVVNVRFATSAVAGGAAELFAYGTAVIVQG